MVKILRSHRRRWRGVPLGGPLQRGCKFCLAANDGETKTRPANAGQRDGPRLATTHPPSPRAPWPKTTLSKKRGAFDDEVALTVAPFYLVHMLQRTLPAGFIAPCLPTKTD